ncbi:hypothetical protein EI534_48915, partial [Pseudomonas frederiksbergensis]|nr:hypothetical protein [Pseudomonas frederiksbergensis]
STLSHGRVPQWTPAMPQPLKAVQLTPASNDARPRVVYLAACVSRVMGPAATDREQTSLLDKTRALLEKAGYQVVFP